MSGHCRYLLCYVLPYIQYIRKNPRIIFRLARSYKQLLNVRQSCQTPSKSIAFWEGQEDFCRLQVVRLNFALKPGIDLVLVSHLSKGENILRALLDIGKFLLGQTERECCGSLDHCIRNIILVHPKVRQSILS